MLKIKNQKQLVEQTVLRLVGALNEPTTDEARKRAVKILTDWEHSWRNFLCVEVLVSCLLHDKSEENRELVIEWLRGLKKKPLGLIHQSFRMQMANSVQDQIRVLYTKDLFEVINRDVLSGLYDGQIGPMHLSPNIQLQAYPDRVEILIACSFLASPPKESDSAMITQWLITGLNFLDKPKNPIDLLGVTEFREHMVKLVIAGKNNAKSLLEPLVLSDSRFWSELEDIALKRVPEMNTGKCDSDSQEYKQALKATRLLAEIIERHNLPTPDQIKKNLSHWSKQWLFMESAIFLKRMKHEDRFPVIDMMGEHYLFDEKSKVNLATIFDALPDDDTLVIQFLTERHYQTKLNDLPENWLMERIRKSTSSEIYLKKLLEYSKKMNNNLHDSVIDQLLQAFDEPNEELRQIVDKWIHGQKDPWDRVSEFAIRVIERVRKLFPEMGLGMLLSSDLYGLGIRFSPHELDSAHVIERLFTKSRSRIYSEGHYPLDDEEYWKDILLAKCADCPLGRSTIVNGFLDFWYRDNSILTKAVDFLKSDKKYRKNAIRLAEGLFNVAWDCSYTEGSLDVRARELILAYPDGLDWLGERGHWQIMRWLDHNWDLPDKNFLKIFEKVYSFERAEYFFNRMIEEAKKGKVHFPSAGRSIWGEVFGDVASKKRLMSWIEKNHNLIQFSEIIGAIDEYGLEGIGKAKVYAMTGLNYSPNHPEFPKDAGGDIEFQCAEIRELCAKILDCADSK